MKVAIYTIALNEEQFVERWFNSAKDADYLLIADTGSSDNTIALAKQFGINVVSISVSPWRFDDARNAALSHIPTDIDYCISLDMDEIISDGWREHLEKAHALGITRPKYKHIWSWNDDGTPGLEFAYDHIHSRSGYRWRHPVHEVLTPYQIEETTMFLDGLETHHHPDKNKSRSQYLGLLELSVKEDPNSDRNAYYYARELFFNGKYKEAIREFERHLSLPTANWMPERASSYRYLAKCDPDNAMGFLSKAISCSPNRREAIVELSLLYYKKHMWQECYQAAVDAIEIKDKPLDYLCESFAWGALPYDLAAISAYNLGKKEEATIYGTTAAALEPENKRLLDNLYYYKLNV